MTLGLADRQGSLLNDMERFCDQSLPERSIYAVLHRERDRLFPDEMFADLFSDKGRRSVPPSVVATVMVLQRLEGLSDREAVERYAFDTRWRYAAGLGSYDCGGWASFAHTVLVDMRARLAASSDPRRIFTVTVKAAGQAGLLGAKRVLDSTPLYDAVATMDTITLIRSAIRGLLRLAGPELEAELRDALRAGDDYETTAKPQIDWDDPDSREALISSRAKDALRCLVITEGRSLGPEVAEAVQLLATVVGQDLEETEDGGVRIARRVAKDRIISTVDTEARHGHKTSVKGFDGFKASIALDPDAEIITDTAVSAANVGDGAVAPALIEDLAGATSSDATDADQVELDRAGNGQARGPSEATSTQAPTKGHRGAPRAAKRGRKAKAAAQVGRAARAATRRANGRTRAERRRRREARQAPVVYGDSAYGSGEFLSHLVSIGVDPRLKTQPPVAREGHFAKDRFAIDLEANTVTCPADQVAPVRYNSGGDGLACFGETCRGCSLRSQCTTAEGGRSISVSRHEALLAEARQKAKDPDWAGDYRATRPKVERKLGHLMRRRHGGRRVRVRGKDKVDADFNLLAAAHNLARLGVLGLRGGHSWTFVLA